MGDATAPVYCSHRCPANRHPVDPHNPMLQVWEGEDGVRAKDAVEVWVARMTCVGVPRWRRASSDLWTTGGCAHGINGVRVICTHNS